MEPRNGRARKSRRINRIKRTLHLGFAATPPEMAKYAKNPNPHHLILRSAQRVSKDG
jgi:hypothetical protein